MSSSQTSRDFYRTFSDGCSVGGIVSGKGKQARHLFIHELLCEFNSHKTGARKLNEEFCHERLTALVSVTISFIDALRRAFDKFYGGHKREKIWIVFISVPHKDKATYHHAKHLAQELGLEEPNMFKDEYVFEWEVPEKYIVHKVSVHTLLSRGFSMERYCEFSNDMKQLPPAYLLRQIMAKRILNPATGGYDIGMSLGFMARCFGARAPVRDIAYRILSECSRVRFVDHHAQSVRVSYWRGHETALDFEHFCWIDRGIDEALLDLWLSDIDFYRAYKEHCEWVSMLKDEMERDWETFGEKIYYEEISDPELHYRTLQEKEENMQAEIEIAAVKLGL